MGGGIRLTWCLVLPLGNRLLKGSLVVERGHPWTPSFPGHPPGHTIMSRKSSWTHYHVQEILLDTLSCPGNPPGHSIDIHPEQTSDQTRHHVNLIPPSYKATQSVKNLRNHWRQKSVNMTPC